MDSSKTCSIEDDGAKRVKAHKGTEIFTDTSPYIKHSDTPSPASQQFHGVDDGCTDVCSNPAQPTESPFCCLTPKL